MTSDKNILFPGDGFTDMRPEHGLRALCLERLMLVLISCCHHFEILNNLLIGRTDIFLLLWTLKIMKSALLPHQKMGFFPGRNVLLWLYMSSSLLFSNFFSYARQAVGMGGRKHPCTHRMPWPLPLGKGKGVLTWRKGGC